MVIIFPTDFTDFILKLNDKILSQIVRIKQIILASLICEICLICEKIKYLSLKILFIENHAELVHVFRRRIVLNICIMIF